MIERAQAWFAARGWEPFDFQLEAWRAYLAGESGLVHAPTGMGKTLAVWMGPVLEALATRMNGSKAPPGLQVLWITPLRALAGDTVEALRDPVEALGLDWTIELRTSDVSNAVRQRQRRRLPDVLVTTPESLSILLSYPDAAEKFATLRCVIVDEWHELMGNKRGVQTELCLARLRHWRPGLRTWGLSATLENLEQARDVLVGPDTPRPPVLLRGLQFKHIEVLTLLPETIDSMPWSGHLGVKMLPQVIAQLERAQTTLLFTNTRSQAELWFRAILRDRPDWLGRIALHHGSLDREIRQRVEVMLREGRLLAVVCTSSLDLGVDFRPVDQVMQLGSPKGIARLMQRAGRSGHQPGAVSRVVCVPTHAFELVEFSAAREAVAARRIEPRLPLDRPLDVLVQHLVTVAAGGGFVPRELYDEVRCTHAFRGLTRQQWRWAMQFVERGGSALGAYPQYRRVVRRARRCNVASDRLARQHRMMIGTITSETVMAIRFRNGRKLGTIEESFITRLNPGDRFYFSGRALELVRVREMTAWVKPTKRRSGRVPRWAGTRFPLSTRLADGVVARFEQAQAGQYSDAEMQTIRPLLELQRKWSALPTRDELLLEVTRTDEGHHHFLYPFEGRLVHEGLGALVAHRLAQQSPLSVVINVNDYGIELMTTRPLDRDGAGWQALLTQTHLIEDLLACLNTTQMARRQFRDIARIAGLIFSGYPSEQKSARLLQASSDLFYDVFSEFDPQNLLLDQARREVLEEQLEVRRLRAALERVSTKPVRIVRTDRLTPLSFPLWADRLREQHLSTEKWEDRIRAAAAL